MSTKKVCGPTLCTLLYDEEPIGRSAQCKVGTQYDFYRDAKNCQAQLERGERNASAAYYVNEDYLSGKLTRGPRFTLQRCESGDVFTWEIKMKLDTESRACAAALTQKTGLEYEAVETNPGMIYSDFTVLPKWSGSVFGDFAALLQKYLK